MMAQKRGWLIPRHKLEKGGDSSSTYFRVVRPYAASPSLVPFLVPLSMHLGGVNSSEVPKNDLINLTGNDS